MIAWLEYSEFEKLAKTRWHTGDQVITVPVDYAALNAATPISETDLPGVERRWYTFIGERPVVLMRQEPTSYIEVDTVSVWTPYRDEPLDWKILYELQGLADFIDVNKVQLITSRSKCLDHVVYRPHWRGWNDAIYRAASRTEANELVEYLRHDAFNESCFVAQEPSNEMWTVAEIVNGKEVGRASHPLERGAIKIACGMSFKSPTSTFVVEDVPETRRYLAVGGKVVSRIHN